MRQKRLINITCITIFFVGGFFVFTPFASADVLGQQTTFYVDSSYDAYSRSSITASMKAIGARAYFYVDNTYWAELDGTARNSLREKLEDLADEFDTVIYPKERAVFGSEWNPGIDNDSRITVLVTKLKNDAGGYINTYDEFPKSQIASSNEREMIYLDGVAAVDSKNGAYLAHEFQHLISFYQKTVLHNVEEEVWLNEARSELAPTICGYNDYYPRSYLADRIYSFLDEPTDSLTEWKNNFNDYGVVSAFLHYLKYRYGNELITSMMLNNLIGISSINEALSDLGYAEKFEDVYADWAIASYLNDCSVGSGSAFCYENKDITYERLHVDESASYSGFPNLIVKRSSTIKDWSPRWYRFRQNSIEATSRDTLKIEFETTDRRADFYVPYIVLDNGNTTVQFIALENQKGEAYIPNFSSLNKTVILVPFNTFQQKGFSNNEPSTAFTFIASSIDAGVPIITSVTPNSGAVNGGYAVALAGSNLLDVASIVFGSKAITSFNILSDNQIAFVAPAGDAGSIELTLTDKDGKKVTLANAFTYTDAPIVQQYPDGAMLRAKGDYKVYIIKGNYKRWIQTAELFNMYGHLKWEDIIDVPQQDLDQYTESWMIRADGDKRVWELNADGTKHWLNMTAEQFSLTGHLWEMVYIVNGFERDYYKTGADVMYNG